MRKVNVSEPPKQPPKPVHFVLEALLGLDVGNPLVPQGLWACDCVFKK